jgi:hypothetical protein
MENNCKYVNEILELIVENFARDEINGLFYDDETTNPNFDIILWNRFSILIENERELLLYIKKYIRK